MRAQPVRVCVLVCVHGKLLKIKFFSHSEIFMVQLRLFLRHSALRHSHSLNR